MPKSSTERVRQFRARQKERQLQESQHKVEGIRGGIRPGSGRPKGTKTTTKTTADRCREYRQRIKENREGLILNNLVEPPVTNKLIKSSQNLPITCSPSILLLCGSKGNEKLSYDCKDRDYEMTTPCSIPTCNSHTLQMPMRTLHRLPKNLKRAQEWAKICGYPQWLDNGLTHARKNIRLCSLHFSPVQFRGTQMKQLRNGSMPTITDPLAIPDPQRNDNWKLSQSRICSQHFKKSDIMNATLRPIHHPTSHPLIVKVISKPMTTPLAPPTSSVLRQPREKLIQQPPLRLINTNFNSEFLCKPVSTGSPRGPPKKCPPLKDDITMESSKLQTSLLESNHISLKSEISNNIEEHEKNISKINETNEDADLSKDELIEASQLVIVKTEQIDDFAFENAQNIEFDEKEELCPPFKNIKLEKIHSYNDFEPIITDESHIAECSKNGQSDELYFNVEVKSEEIANTITKDNEDECGEVEKQEVEEGEAEKEEDESEIEEDESEIDINELEEFEIEIERNEDAQSNCSSEIRLGSNELIVPDEDGTYLVIKKKEPTNGPNSNPTIDKKETPIKTLSEIEQSTSSANILPVYEEEESDEEEEGDQEVAFFNSLIPDIKNLRSDQRCELMKSMRDKLLELLKRASPEP